jgi:hypothetical protein
MTEKIDNSDISHDEKQDEKNEFDGIRRPSLAESAGRRRSVALNIVQNPLKVSELSNS